MKHRIVVLGAGYAGTNAAGRLARRLHPDDVEITLVNADDDFVERIRLHQLATGQEMRRRPLAGTFAGTAVRLRIARVTAVDPEQRTVRLTDGEINYDTLVYALGSTAAGVTVNAHHVAGRPAAERLSARLTELAAGSTVLVVGGGLTGIEATTEIAEARPDLHVAIAVRGGLGDWLSDKARRHLRTAVTRLAITVHEHTQVERSDETGARTATGERIPADVTVWTTGFATHPIASATSLRVAATGQIVVDATMRSVSHPEVYAVGDAAIAEGPGGKPLRMSCASGGPMAWQAADAIAARLTGRKVPRLPIRYYAQCISLGRHDGIIQLVTADDRAKPSAIVGRPAARVKEWISAGAAWGSANPTLLLPFRRRHVTAQASAQASSSF
ncbi:NADH dehydrogenase FAD-containing subunit [Actinoplanes tereljensis]|uniref:Oxidoreductase n=1 Tax=Paractinoplanes tereljensis TaxID=571912 RepID=A0A919TRX6_9ACTN|nr:FAD-dependent oxidoreductase [Actinoplanes tereljensis]GIF20778.1 oxidoreductase [Actinoplanes tereljensis]